MQDEAISALSPKSDIGVGRKHVRYGPKAVIRQAARARIVAEQDSSFRHGGKGFFGAISPNGMRGTCHTQSPTSESVRAIGGAVLSEGDMPLSRINDVTDRR